MSGALDEDTRRTIAGGREAAGQILRAAQRNLQQVFIVFVVSLVGTIILLQNYLWDALKDDLLTQEAEVVAVTPFEVILLQFKIGLIVGVILAIPTLLYLSRDALRRRGWLPKAPIARWKLAFIGLGVVTLFVVGIAYAYLLFFPIMFQFLIDTAVNSGFTPTYSITKWMEFIILLSLSFGIAAQLPLVMSTLAYAEIVPYETFRDRWKHAVFGLYAAGALFTPPDPITQLMWATPLVVLYAASLKFTRVVVTIKRSSDRMNFAAIARSRWNVIAGVSVVAFLAIYLFFTAGGIETLNETFGSSEYWPTLTPLGEYTGLQEEIAAGLVGTAVAIVVAIVVFYRFVSRELDALAPTAPASVGDPSEIDVSELDAAGVRAAPPEVFEEMSEDEAMGLASTAIEDNDPDKAEAILDRFDEAQERTEEAAEPTGTAEQPETTAETTELPAEEQRPPEAGPPPEERDTLPEDKYKDDSEQAASGSGEEGSGNVVTETTAGVVDAFTDDETTEEDIGGYYYDITFILESLTSKAFRIVGLFMLVLGGLFVWLYRGGIKQINDDFTARLPEGMRSEDVQTVALHPVEHLIFEIKFSALVAIAVTLPLIVYYAWPALKSRGLVTGDRRVLIVWGGSLVAGIALGSYVGYTQVAPAVISWLAQDALGANMVIAYRIKYYGWMVVYTTVGIGLLAEIPVTMLLFHFGGLISVESMWRRWREVTIAIFAFAAFISPSGIFTMLILAIPITLAFYLGLAVLWVLTFGGRSGGGGTVDEQVEEPA
ncbi:twin-arginine translocase subunit TatC [Halapricum salinum]|uniref:Sec-independent protein translocase protein TatC n=1 Tax=Halapricum salinum TaxID=1457250 RepID=A0A4D6HCW6_9EURY|nr:twin-arginine translocase subunit TatC [Halapricum salinum]QCC51833.1 preprotein translocase subunit TatC [Halapricum salinum]